MKAKLFSKSVVYFLKEKYLWTVVRVTSECKDQTLELQKSIVFLKFQIIIEMSPGM